MDGWMLNPLHLLNDDFYVRYFRPLHRLLIFFIPGTGRTNSMFQTSILLSLFELGTPIFLFSLSLGISNQKVTIVGLEFWNNHNVAETMEFLLPNQFGLCVSKWLKLDLASISTLGNLGQVFLIIMNSRNFVHSYKSGFRFSSWMEFLIKN